MTAQALSVLIRRCVLSVVWTTVILVFSFLSFIGLTYVWQIPETDYVACVVTGFYLFAAAASLYNLYRTWRPE